MISGGSVSLVAMDLKKADPDERMNGRFARSKPEEEANYVQETFYSSHCHGVLVFWHYATSLGQRLEE